MTETQNPSAEPMSMEAATKAMREALQTAVRKHSLWYIIQGVLMVLAGIVALIYPLISSAAIIYVLGWLLIVTGVFQAISLIGSHNVHHFWLQLLSAALAVIVGLMFVLNPEVAVITVSLLLIVFFMVEGVSKVILAFTIRPMPNWGWVLASGLVGILLSIFLLANPVSTLWVLGLFIGILLVVEGAALAYMAWKIRNSPGGLEPF